MYKVLVVEDSITVRKIVNKLIEDNPHFTCDLCEDLAEASAALANNADYLAAIVDLNLPDAPNGESVELALSYNLPTIVLTGNFDEFTRSQLLDQGVLDYITKESRYSYLQVSKLIDRLRKNLNTKVLVVEDSKTSRHHICNLLKKFQFQVHEANDGIEALEELDKHQDIKMVISDHRMPNMDGYELVKAIRHEKRLQDLVFIGLSATGDSVLTSKFIKSGANDFLSKPFYHEEFYCRIMQNLESQEMIQTIRDNANLDPLTKVYNRRYLYEKAEELYANKESRNKVIVSMIDADNFKNVNDTLGHKTGDTLLQEFAALLQEYFPDDLIVRYGGEEFTVVSLRPPKLYLAAVSSFMNAVRTTPFTPHKFNITCSIGVCAEEYDCLESQLDVADARLYHAKHSGKDCIVTRDSNA
ncbi:diguanylate cyclase response regulator [Alteromonas sp. KUL42]|uniref:response regulator n=1 Tax=Alteromonas sp. KUL42 TaxID=2480797 RepID=UPI00103597EC|nr:response regulator [Alteromonas sp. KUL42]TAP38121.1 response regulator [Alteromonas sp. KUL42]GEA05326.1 diguanylate cyclase response regulator [Alteromonas sp. KUL42]